MSDDNRTARVSEDPNGEPSVAILLTADDLQELDADPEPGDRVAYAVEDGSIGLEVLTGE